MKVLPFRSLLRLLAVGLSLALTASAADSTPEFFYHYKKARTELVLDETAVAVKLRSEAARSQAPADDKAKGLAARTSQLGYGQNDAKSFRPGGWVSMDIGGASSKLAQGAPLSRKDKHKRLLNDLAPVDDVEFVSPIFRDKAGNPVYIDQGVIVSFVDGTSEAIQAETIARLGSVGTVERLGKKNRWIVRTTFRNGIDLLDAANSIASLPHVKYADPNFVVTGIPR